MQRVNRRRNDPATTVYSRSALRCCTAVGVLFALAGLAVAGPPTRTRIDEIAAMLAPRPSRLAPTCAERRLWEALAQRAAFQAIVKDAERLMEKPLPEQPDELYLDFSRTGNRTRWQRVASTRRGQVKTLVLAECVENKGRFVPPLQKLVQALCAEPTWVYPAHDRSLRNFKRKQVDIDLGSSHLGSELALAHYLLGDKLAPGTRTLINATVRARVLDPFRAMVRGERSPNWWLTTTNNWNSVCLAGVTGAGLALVKDRHERAFYVAAAEQYSRNFLRGFTADGYCSEGLGYWNYGFGRYALLSELVRRATDGRLDLLEAGAARQPAQFGRRVEIVGGVYPSFSDCSMGTRPDSALMDYLACQGPSEPANEPRFRGSPGRGSLAQALAFGFARGRDGSRFADGGAAGAPLRTWFEEAGVLICRPASGTETKFGAALKGGHNAEHHNHNDVGSFIVVVRDRPVLVDPGTEVYTARTFSGRRYESNVLNSYGHSVPVVAGRLQQTGSEARGRVLKHEFTDAVDTIAIDLSSAYKVAALERLEREFRYERDGAGRLTVVDSVAFAAPEGFATALVTFGDWRRIGPSMLRVEDDGRAVEVELHTSGPELTLRAVEIDEDVPAGCRPTRIAIEFAEPVRAARLTMRISPVFDDESARGHGRCRQTPTSR